MAKLKYDFHIYAGATPKTENPIYWDGDIIWITPADYKTSDKYVSQGKRTISKEGYQSCNTQIVPKGSLIFSKRAPIGTIAIAVNELCTNQGCLSCVPKDVSSTYFFYIISVSTEAFELLGSGATFKEISANYFANVKLPLPPLSEQQAIASYLDAKTKPIDDIIAKREKQIELLEEMKSAIISRAVTKGLNPDAKMKDSGIEWIKTEPQSWETRRIKNVITLLTDYDANGSFADIAKNVKVNVGEPYAWMVRATDLANKRYGIVDDNNYCNKETYDFLSKSSLEAGDILIAKRGDIGKSYEVPKCDCPMTLAPNTYLLKTNKKVISNRFFHYFFMSDYGKKQLSINNKSTTIGALYKDDVKNLKILLPPMHEQQAIASYLDSETSKIDTRIAKRRKQIELLQEYKQALITAAVTGKIDVREYNS
ncbi:MAG: restriction endonuclease subunit S [Bacteroidaceae bacterium]|nr:restriction endonuclease subunit S [Bacteroidaceae bacterium]